MLRLGKKPARPGAVAFRFGSYFANKLPAPPTAFGYGEPKYPNRINSWGMLANDRTSDCVQAGAAHETMLWAAQGGNSVTFGDGEVLADYLAVNPGDTSYSGGTDLQEYVSYRKNTGIMDASGKRHLIDAYVALDVGNINQVALAAYLCGAVGIGVSLPNNAEDQFNAAQAFDVSANDGGPAGGHYMPLIGRNSLGNFLFVTWGRLQAATPAWVHRYMDEGVAYLSLERLRNSISPEGFNEAQLLSDLSSI